MKRILVLLCLIFVFLPTKVHCELDVLIDGEDEYNTYVENITKGEMPFSAGDIWDKLCDTLFLEVKKSKKMLGEIIVLSALSGIVSLADRLGTNTAHFAILTLMSTIMIRLSGEIVGYAVSVTENICDFITKLLPILLGLLAVCGKFTSQAVFSPVISAAVYVISLVVKKWITPMIYFGTVMCIVGNITNKVQICRINQLLKSVTHWILISMLTVFTGVLTLYGINAPAVDAVANRTARLAVGRLVPVVGGLLADTLETVVLGAKIIKNAVGSAGMICIISIAAVPIIKIWLVCVMIRLSVAISEPVCDMRISRMMNDFAQMLSTVIAVLITAMALFIIAIGIILASTGG